MFGYYKDSKTIEGINKFMAYLKPASVSASLIAISLVLALSTTLALMPTNKAYAITPPDSCFNFNAGTNTITGYYEHENNNPSDPACPKALDIPSTIGGVAVNVIGDSAFEDKDLTSATIPSTVTSINRSAFSRNQLASVTIPNLVIYMGVSSFENNLLTNVTIPSSVTTIGDYAFMFNKITSVTIPSSVTSIGSYAFNDNKLSEISLPDSLTSIDPVVAGVQTDLATTVSYSDWYFSGGSNTTLGTELINGAVATPIYVNPSLAISLNINDLSPTEADTYGSPDINGDGDASDIVFAQLINPSRAVVKYQDESGNDLLPSSTITGYDTGSSTTLTNYLLKDNPSKDINAYFKAGDIVDLPSAPAISGYSLVSTPPATLALSTTGANEIVYTYKTGGNNSIPNAEDSSTVVLDLPSSTTLSNFVAVKESSLAVQDSGYNYPLGLIDFSFSTSTTDNTVSLLFVTDLKPNQVIAKKYDPSTKGYTTLDNATITETTHNNQHALLLTYTITDNGDLDLDKTTGIIKDPVGLATLAVGSPNTGVR